MNIADIREKCKKLLSTIPRDILIVGILIGASLASFGLGYLAGRDAGQGSEIAEATLTPTGSTGEVVASKTGTKYYLPSCSGVDKISDTNKVYFASPDLARTQGYEPADNCAGL
jgi:hypothetical protein